MKKVLFGMLMLSAMFVLAACGSKSNSSNEESKEVAEEEKPTVEIADPAITYTEANFNSGEYQNVPLNGCFEIQKVAVAKTANENRNSEYSYKVVATINLKMIKDYPEKVDFVRGNIQLINKDGAVLATLSAILDKYKGMKIGDVAICSDYKLAEYDADGLVADTKYIRLADLNGSRKVEK